MTTTPVDMMSEAWIDKIEAETKTPEQTFKTSTNMTIKKTTSSIGYPWTGFIPCFSIQRIYFWIPESRHHPASQ
jgi:hypothetical protein